MYNYTVFLNYTCFLFSNLFNCISKNCCVFQTYCCNNRSNRSLQCIGGIKSSSKPRLHNSKIYFLLSKGKNRNAKKIIKIRQFISSKLPVHLFYCQEMSQESILAYHFTINPDSLPYINKMGRCK